MNTEFAVEVEELVKQKVEKKKDASPVVFYGSSSFRLWDSLKHDIPEIESLNIAFGGSTIEDCIGYYDQLLKPLKPSKIFFYAGDNDIGNGASVDVTVKRFVALLALVKRDFPTTGFVFLSIKPSPERMPFIKTIQEVNAQIESIISTEPNCGFVDIHTAMMNGEMVREELFCEDMLHMNEHGYAIWAEKVRAFLGV